MSYRCQMCGAPQSGQPTRVTTKAREVTYLRAGPKGEDTHGEEIAEEKLACPPCARNAPSPQVIGSKHVGSFGPSYRLVP